MTLPVLHVKTEHSEYVIDQGAGTFSRRRVHKDANDLSYGGVNDDAVLPYVKIYSPLEVGERLVIITPDGGWVRSTPIASIEEVASV